MFAICQRSTFTDMHVSANNYGFQEV